MQLCFASIRRHANGADVRILDKKSYCKYVNIPQFILKKVEEGKITLTHLSDIIRFMLIRNHGGLWIDSTVFLKCDIPHEIFESELYTLNHTVHLNEIETNITKGRWVSWLIGEKRGGALSDAMSRIFIKYWENHERLITYLFVDYCIEKCYSAIPEVKHQIDKIPPCGGYLWDLLERRNTLSDVSSINGMFQKTSWKVPYCCEISGKVTLWGHALEEYGIEYFEFDYSANVSNSKKDKLRHITFSVRKYLGMIQEFGLQEFIWYFLCSRTTPWYQNVNNPPYIRKIGINIQNKYHDVVQDYLAKQECYTQFY